MYSSHYFFVDVPVPLCFVFQHSTFPRERLHGFCTDGEERADCAAGSTSSRTCTCLGSLRQANRLRRRCQRLGAHKAVRPKCRGAPARTSPSHAGKRRNAEHPARPHCGGFGAPCSCPGPSRILAISPASQRENFSRLLREPLWPRGGGRPRRPWQGGRMQLGLRRQREETSFDALS